MYNECIGLTRQFAFCPNAFRVDLYKGCSFGCKYCFANTGWQKNKKENQDIADIDKLKRLFHKALETDKESKDINVELLRHRVPIHCGGMSDPFQSREWKYGLTYDFIKLTRYYNYPVMFSTKSEWLPDKYINILNPYIHAFQFSIIGLTDDYINKWECNTESAKERIGLMCRLRSRGFWCGLRVQPIIDIEEVIALLEYIKGGVDYVTIEHFKMVYDIEQAKEAFIKLVDNKTDFVTDHNKLQVKKYIKKRNIERIQKMCNSYGVQVGVGDNDLHYMTQGRTCCGIDRVNDNFKNYLKYNLTYQCTGDYTGNEWCPSCNPRKHINDQKYGLQIDCKQYVDDYIRNHPDYMNEKKRVLF